MLSRLNSFFKGQRLKIVRHRGFFKSWIANPFKVGAILPSGEALAREMAHHVDLNIPGMILELGPGTGPVTQALIERGVPRQRLVLVEYDAGFCVKLRHMFPGVHVIQGDAYQLKKTLGLLQDQPVCAIVSSLPLLTRPREERRNLLEDSFELIDPKGSFIQFTYGILSPIPLEEGRARFVAKASAPIWRNVPPARVWVYRPKVS